MDLKEKTDSVVELMRGTKESWVEQDPKNPDLGIFLHFFRGDEVVVTIQCALDRDASLNAARLGAMGFNATTIALTFESYHSTLKKSPLTGNDWMHQEMQFVSETVPDAAEKGWVWPCLTTSIHERGGEFAMASTPYSITDDKVVWYEDKSLYLASSEPDSSGAGVMFEFLQDSMKEPTMEEKIAETAKKDATSQLMLDLVKDPEARLFHSDMATFRTLEERNLITGAVFSAEDGSVRKEMLKDRFGEPSE
jgi:hypothetical protein